MPHALRGVRDDSRGPTTARGLNNPTLPGLSRHLTTPGHDHSRDSGRSL